MGAGDCDHWSWSRLEPRLSPPRGVSSPPVEGADRGRGGNVAPPARRGRPPGFESRACGGRACRSLSARAGARGGRTQRAGGCSIHESPAASAEDGPPTRPLLLLGGQPKRQPGSWPPQRRRKWSATSGSVRTGTCLGANEKRHPFMGSPQEAQSRATFIPALPPELCCARNRRSRVSAGRYRRNHARKRLSPRLPVQRCMNNRGGLRVCFGAGGERQRPVRWHLRTCSSVNPILRSGSVCSPGAV